VTISIGIAALSDPADGAASILKRADQALYRAKRDGRNWVVLDAA
jgi:two-component system cell cycle response regulator